MKHDALFIYVTDTDVAVTIASEIDGVTVSTKDGDHSSRFVISANDAVEMANMLSKAAVHYKELEKTYIPTSKG